MVTVEGGITLLPLHARCLDSSPQTCECQGRRQRGIKVAGGIKLANQLTLKQGDYPGLWGRVGGEGAAM